MRESWTDARMDDLNTKVDELGRRMDNGFNRVDADIRALREETKAEFSGIRKEMKTESAALRSEMKTESTALSSEMNERFEGMQDRLDAIQRMMLWFCGLAMTALVGLIAALLGAVIPQL